MFIDKIAWLYMKDRKVLSTRSKGKDTYYFPGGKREGNETDLQTLTREIREELSVDLLPDTVQYFGTFEAQAHGKAEGITVCMTCYTAQYSGQLQPASEIEEMVWFTSADAGRSSPVDKLIFAELKRKDLID